MCAGLSWGGIFPDVERAADAAEAFILVEDPHFAENLGLVVVGLNRPGMGSPAFVAELTSRLPSFRAGSPSRTGRGRFHAGPNVRFLPRSTPSEQLIAVSRQMMRQSTARVA